MPKVHIGIDIGGTKIFGGVIDQKGDVLETVKRPTPLGAEPEEVYEVVLDVIDKLMKKEKLDKGDLIGIGMGIPGVVAPNAKDIFIAPNINLAGFDLARKLEKEYKTEVVLGNDVNLGLLGEKWLGVAKKYDHVIGIFPGTGVGGGIIINGKLVYGAQGAAAELGHVQIDRSSEAESAGQKGTLEALAGRRSIEKAIRKRIDAGDESIVSELLNDDLRQIKSKILAQALKANDKVVCDVMDDVAATLGQACISFRHMLNPEMIVFGGGVIEACGFYLLPKIKEISDADPFFKNVDHCRIVASSLKDDAVILGATALLRQTLGKKLK